MRKIISSIFMFALVFLVFGTSNVSAKVISDQQGPVIVAKGEVVNDDLFIGAQSVEIDGVVNGDVFVGAQNVRIAGTVNGNLHVGAQTLDISGKVTGNVYSGSQSFAISDKASIGNSVFVGAETVSINSKVGRNVYAGANTINLGPNAVIGNNLYYSATKENVSIDSTSQVVGSTYKSEFETPERQQVPVEKKSIIEARLGGSAISFLGALIVGFAYLKLFARNFKKTTTNVSERFWKSFGTGFLVTVTAVPALIIAAVTIVGLPIAGVAVLLLSLYSYLAKIVVAAALGAWTTTKLKWKFQTFASFSLGLLAIYILKMIPLVGFLTSLTVLWAGLGALTLNVFVKNEK